MYSEQLEAIIDAALADGMFESVRTAILFLIVAIAVITVLCFIPIFKSKSNVRWAI